MRDATIFRQEWFPLASEIAFKGTIFNWGSILSSNLKATIEGTIHIDIHLKSNFFMSSYLIDIVCSQHPFLKMKWSWNPTDSLIHLYCDLLWDFMYRSNDEHICNDFIHSTPLAFDRQACVLYFGGCPSDTM